jgi:DNA gyrase subunit A
VVRVAADNDDPERIAPPPQPPSGSGADAIVASVVRTTARADIGAVTSAGRMIKLSVIEVPQGEAHPVTEFVTLADDEKVLALATLDTESAGVVLGTAGGVVKRVVPEYPGNRDEFEMITLKDGDRVIGAAQLSSDDAELVFIASDAQLLRFPAASVRPQGRPAGGMAGIRLDEGAQAIWFGAIGPAAPGSVPECTAPAAAKTGNSEMSGELVVITAAGRSDGLPGTSGVSVKVTPFSEYPAKGRATGGVRCQRFLKGEDALVLAWIGPGPVLGLTERGIQIDLSEMRGRRDGSGTQMTRPLAYLGTTSCPR